MVSLEISGLFGALVALSPDDERNNRIIKTSWTLTIVLNLN